jgi:hypothetical protein
MYYLAVEDGENLDIYDGASGHLVIKCWKDGYRMKYYLTIYANSIRASDPIGSRPAIDALMQVYTVMIAQGNTIGAAIVGEYIHIFEGQE